MKPAPGTRWLHKSGRRVVRVVRVHAQAEILGERADSAIDIVDYYYERTVGGMGRNRSTPTQSMPLETWRGIFTKQAPDK